MSQTSNLIVQISYVLLDGRTLVGQVSKIRDAEDAVPELWQICDWGELADVISAEDVLAFAQVSRDVQWIHTDRERAKAAHGGLVVHGALTSSLVSALYGNVMPGPGAIYLESHVSFKKMVIAGQCITARATIASYAPNGIMRLDTRVTNEEDVVVAEGNSVLLVRRPK
jgi:acyl dehydratase